MSTTAVILPTSRIRFGLAQVDITPPVGIYHPMWGAARHDLSTGVHRPLSAEVMAFGSLGDADAEPLIRVQMDWVGVHTSQQHDDLVQALSDGGGVSTERILIGFSHTHAGGLFAPNRMDKPGGELIAPYLAEVAEKLKSACREAVSGMQDVAITYGTGRCNMAANRDYWDVDFNGYTCGYNPDAPADDTVMVARVTTFDREPVATVVNYACHPTTLAWENTRISPDYVGAMREEVTQATGTPCVFIQGACGDLGPRDGFVGDTDVADRNGRQLAFAALSTLSSMGPPENDFVYAGPVVSGATLGAWTNQGFDDARRAQASCFSGGIFSVDVPYIDLPKRADLERELAEWREKQQAADARGDPVEARNCGAQAERRLRWMGRIEGLPEGETYPVLFSVFRMGDAVWVTTGGEPYHVIQVELRRRFPEFSVMFSPLVGVMNIAYLLPEDQYGKGLYQEEPSILAQGCLEILTEAVAERIQEVTS